MLVPNAVPDEVTINLNMLCESMEHRFVCEKGVIRRADVKAEALQDEKNRGIPEVDACRPYPSGCLGGMRLRRRADANLAKVCSDGCLECLVERWQTIQCIMYDIFDVDWSSGGGECIHLRFDVKKRHIPARKPSSTDFENSAEKDLKWNRGQNSEQISEFSKEIGEGLGSLLILILCFSVFVRLVRVQ
ncbi:hypothetical protein KFK09_023938 [Dendrobium nobile]|uniref:Uncharacterized protein n=1 Tax=Dendrobium nobile TaxID=94219 RepID=A0A8T3ACM0_DENNO|nr:hypothetical protein KFK09_023938 [Dendrobium nobile]